MLQLRHIEACHAVFQTGAITRAAGLLGISQPAVSKLIKHAEQQLGFRLFERIKGRLVPTREAEMMAPEIAKVFDQLGHLRRLGQNLAPHGQGRIRVGCIPSLGMSVVPDAIQRFQKAHPEISYEVSTQHTAQLIQSLMAQDLDIAVTFDPAPHMGIRAEKLGHSNLLYVGPARDRSAQRKEIRLPEIDPQQLIGLMESDPVGRLLDREMRSVGMVATPAIRVQTHSIACKLAEKGCGATIVDAYTASSFKDRAVEILRVKPDIGLNTVALHSDLRVLSRHSAAFIRYLKQACSAYSD